MSLPLLKDLGLMQTGWKQLLDPIVANPILQGVAITNISLASGVDKVIPTTLNRMQQGWFITDINANCYVKRTAAFNASNLTLQASSDVTINLWVY